MRILNKIICILIMSFALIFSQSNEMVSYASEKSSYTRGHYLIINTKHNKLAYFKDGKFIKEFETGTGRLRNTLTPEGKFRVANKIVDRPYYSGGIPGGHPDNPLGDRWIGLNVDGTQGSTYGIHGNNDETSIGKNVSAGCIRMHNEEVRWLFSQVPVGSYAIIDYTDDDYYTLAKKYGVRLDPKSRLNTDQKSALKEFEDFYIYGPKKDPVINLLDWRQPIKEVSQAEGILRTVSNGKKYDREYMREAWAKLSSSEKKHPQMAKLLEEYTQIVDVAQASRDCLKFFENVKDNAKSLIEDPIKSEKLNSKSNMSENARGRAYDEYMEAAEGIENSKTSPRMKYIQDKYLDAVYFLRVSEYIGDENVSKAKEYSNKIKDSYLKNIAKSNISDLEDYKSKKSSVEYAFKKFYIYGPMSDPAIDLSNTKEPITSVSHAEGILKTVVNGKVYDRQNFLNKWNTLSSRDKKHFDMQDIWEDYTKIVDVAEASRDCLNFYDNVYKNAENLIYDSNSSSKLNSKENLSSGARGKAYEEYRDVVGHGESNKNSARMKYVSDKYLDAVYFLEVSENIGSGDYNTANEYYEKIENTKLKNIAKDALLNSDGYLEKSKNVKESFNEFVNYKNDSINLDLLDTNDQITDINTAKDILDGENRDKFLTNWNILSDKQKQYLEMDDIYNQYDQIIKALDCIVTCVEFYDNIVANPVYLLENPQESITINSKSNMNNGCRGKAYQDYTEICKYGENNKNSARIKYASDKYLDAVYFLRVSEYISLDNYNKSQEYINKIKDENLKSIAQEYFTQIYVK